MAVQEGINGIGKSRELSDRKPVDRTKFAIRQERKSRIRGTNIAQQQVLT
jgi:hypothetical protein